jgi:uncharacterized protein YjbI with pentapeptide repeats
MRDAPRWQLRLEGFWRTFVHETNFWLAAALFVACLGGLMLWKALKTGLQWSDLWPELGGMTMDILVILIVFEFFQHRRAVQAEINRQRETIDDYKKWDAEEARVRIAGAIRRLNRFGITAVDLAGAVLKDFSFPGAGIRSLAGSAFYDGTWGDPHREAAILMTRVKFDHLDCSKVKFSPFEPLGGLLDFHHARFIDCSFQDSNFSEATFSGAELKWTVPPLEFLEEVVEEDDGRVSFEPLGYGPFHGSVLTGAVFRGCAFHHVDFRGAEDIRGADFAGASGLDSAYFDNAGDRVHVLAAARGSA